MRSCLILAIGIITGIGIGCKRSQLLSVPAEVGQGLPKADSLRAVLNWLEGRKGHTADSLRLYTLFELIEAVTRQNLDSAYRLAEQLQTLARKSTHPEAEGLSHLGWASIHIRSGMYDSALFQARLALMTLGEKKQDRLRARAFHAMGVGYQSTGDYDSALTFYMRAVAIRETLRDQHGLAASYNNIGIIHYVQGRYAEAFKYHQKARQILENLGDKTMLAASYNNLGKIYYDQGRYQEALTYHHKALEMYQAAKYTRGIAGCHQNIGNIYEAQGKYAEALECYQKAAQLMEAVGDKRSLATSLNNIGNIYSSQRRYPEALEYLQKALQIRETVGDKSGVADSYNNIGILYEAQGQYEEALRYYQKASQIREMIGEQEKLAESYNNIGNIHKAQGQYTKALEYYQKANQIWEAIGDLDGFPYLYEDIGTLYRLWGQPLLGRSYLLQALRIAQKLGANERLRDIYLSLSRTDSFLAASGQPAYWKTAYEYARLHHAYSDSVSNKETIRKQAQLESQYEYDKKTALLKAQQEKERALATAELKRRETQRNLSLAALFIALTGMSVFAILYRTIRRQKKLLQAQAEEIQEKNASLEQYNAELQSTNEALEASYRVIQEQADSLLEKNEEILDSIRYAEQIQRAILPSAEKWRRLLPDSFLVYLPRDIVAGDFYWLEETERYVFLGVADATGHGVPGAFVSLVCANALNKAVVEEGLESPGEILMRAKEVVSGLLMQEGGNLRDGMDIALVRFEKEHPWRLVYAGANRPLWIVSQTKEVIELSPTRQPVGYTEVERPFEEVAVDLASRRPVMVYGFTDGIVDQMGGPKGRKLMTKGLRELLLGVADLPCAVQRERIEAFFAEWKGEMRQMDDVTLVGVRVG